MHQSLYETDKEYRSRYVAGVADEHVRNEKHHCKHFGKCHPDKNTNGKTGEYETWFECQDCAWKTTPTFVDYPLLSEIHAEFIIEHKLPLPKL